MKIVRPRIVGFAIVCLAFWQVPSAQAQLTAPREAAQLQFGPLSIYPSLRVVDVGIDDNVFNDTVAEQDDYTFTIASRVMGVLKMGANELMVVGRRRLRLVQGLRVAAVDQRQLRRSGSTCRRAASSPSSAPSASTRERAPTWKSTRGPGGWRT